MLFNSEVFVVFAGVFFAVYFLLPHRGQLLWLLGSSYLFYAHWDWRFLGLLLLSTALNYGVGLALGREADAGRRRGLMWLGVGASLAILALFKYANFFIAGADALSGRLGGGPLPWVWRIALPIGISFYTFHAINYVVDVWRRKIPPERSLLKYAVYIALWPQLVAGPIVRASRLLPQLATRKRFRWANVQKGAEYVVIGFFMKSVVADGLSPLVDRIFAAPTAFSGINVALGVVMFAFQIYGDFAGYSLIAIGLGRVMGFNLGQNFRRPYFSRDFSEFWTRWHISLSRWLRDYLYIPLGGNRRGVLKEYRNLMATMLLGGLWHGASWTYVAWGGLHGSYLSGQRLARPWLRGRTGGRPRRRSRPGDLPAILGVFVLVCVAWVFFRADSFGRAALVFRTLALGGWSPRTIQNGFDVAVALLPLAALVVAEAGVEFAGLDRRLARHKHLRGGLTAALALTLPLLGHFQGASFIYFQF